MVIPTDFFSSSMMILLLSCVIYAVVLAPCFSRSFLSQLSLPLYNTLLYSLYTLLLSVSLSLVLSLPLFLSSLFSQLASFFSVFSLSLVSISPFPIYFPVLELLQSILSHLHLHFRPSYFSLKVQYLRTFRSCYVLVTFLLCAFLPRTTHTSPLVRTVKCLYACGCPEKIFNRFCLFPGM